MVPSAIGSGKLTSYYVDCAVLGALYNASQLGFAFYYLLICLNVLIFLRCSCSLLPHVLAFSVVACCGLDLCCYSSSERGEINSKGLYEWA